MHLNRCFSVSFVAGGFAVALCGYPRYTGDIDSWINATEENATKALQLLQALGYSDKEVNLEDLITPDIIVQFGYPPTELISPPGWQVLILPLAGRIK